MLPLWRLNIYITYFIGSQKNLTHNRFQTLIRRLKKDDDMRFTTNKHASKTKIKSYAIIFRAVHTKTTAGHGFIRQARFRP